MRLLLLQLSDIHFRATANPIAKRLDALLAAIRSVAPRPDGCVLLVTGDVAWSGEKEEYENAERFFEILRSELALMLGEPNLHVGFIPGNHDCLLPKKDAELRAVIVRGIQSSVQSPQPDSGIASNLLSSQTEFFDFAGKFGDFRSSWQEKTVFSKLVKIKGITIRINSFNTAFLSQREELAGSLALPRAIIEDAVQPDSTADLTVSIYHHSENWLEPAFRRVFRKVIESTSDVVFTGHEHEQDYHLTESQLGRHLIYVEGDALQDAGNPQRSGFNAIVIDFASNIQQYFLFRWKHDHYTAKVDGDERPLVLTPKTGGRFRLSQKFEKYLSSEDFGFTHPRKLDLQLDDFYVRPAITIQDPSNNKFTKISGKELFEHVLKERYLFLRGTDLCGKTSLLKTLFKDFYESTTLVPVLLRGEEITTGQPEQFLKTVWSAVRSQYSEEAVELFKQIPEERRVLMVDDWQRARPRTDVLSGLLVFAKTYFGTIIISTSSLISVSDNYPIGSNTALLPIMQSAVINELSPTGRGELIDKWLKLGQGETFDEFQHGRVVEKEQAIVDSLIAKHSVPSLPFLIVGVLQARTDRTKDTADPGSYGYLVMKLVIDALSVTRGARRLIERKDIILRRVAFHLFSKGQDSLTRREFEFIVEEYERDLKVTVDAKEIVEDLLYGRVLEELDENLSFKFKYYFHFFLARYFIDEIEKGRGDEIRPQLNEMAERPLVKSNHLTVIFFLFFRKQDELIERLISQANETLSAYSETDLLEDFALAGTDPSEQMSRVDEEVNTWELRKRRLAAEDCREEKEKEPGSALQIIGSDDISYSDALPLSLAARFAVTRLEMLGQVIRNFPDSLEGERKVRILEAAFRLGLRTLKAILEFLSKIETNMANGLAEARTTELEREYDKAVNALHKITGFLARAASGGFMNLISRAVGVADLEAAYEEAIVRVGRTPATGLVDLAIKLDHSAGFPFKEVDGLKADIPKKAKLPLLVMSDLVVRHTQIYPLRKETLRRIAGLLQVSSVDLYARSRQ